MRNTFPVNAKFGTAGETRGAYCARWQGYAVGFVAIAAGLLLPAPAAALQTTTQGSSAPAQTHKPLHSKLKTKAGVRPDLRVVDEVPVPILPPPPPPPDWPVNDKAAEAAVVWDSHGLRVEATNSSLQAILKEVSTATGTTVEGLSADQRVFGVYGPGDARDVLSQLLQGSGYNVVMIGDQGSGAPRQIVLSARQAGGAQVGAKPAGSDEESDVEEPAPAPEPPQPHFTPLPGREQRTPQQLMEEMQQRDRNRQQQGLPGQVQPNPQN
jgi:hypothetical protein